VVRAGNGDARLETPSGGRCRLRGSSRPNRPSTGNLARWCKPLGFLCHASRSTVRPDPDVCDDLRNRADRAGDGGLLDHVQNMRKAPEAARVCVSGRDNEGARNRPRAGRAPRTRPSRGAGACSMRADGVDLCAATSDQNSTSTSPMGGRASHGNLSGLSDRRLEGGKKRIGPRVNWISSSSDLPPKTARQHGREIRIFGSSSGGASAKVSICWREN